MTNIPPSLALPDSPELPAEIEHGIDRWGTACAEGFDFTADRDRELRRFRSVIAKHLLAEKRKQILAFHDGASITVRCHVKDVYAADKFVEEISAACQEALRLLSGSSRGEE